ncbi:hypothetical protein [Sphingobacterium lumbrici]|uniref:hypothetical protein n=1 Tax=Sphingobacterium lumbrici TaxID=2559600 RepID=UPI00112CDE60|nr:hypothetical protein [Sphingobacterium lumbrici]
MKRKIKLSFEAFFFLIILSCWGVNVVKAQGLADTPYPDGVDSVRFNLIPDIKIPTKTILDSVLKKEFDISVVDYFYYYASDVYLNRAQRLPSTWMTPFSSVSIIKSPETFKLTIKINGSHLLLDHLYSKTPMLSKIKEIDHVKITRKTDPRSTFKGEYVLIEFIVNNNYRGTEYEMSTGGVPELKRRDFINKKIEINR